MLESIINKAQRFEDNVKKAINSERAHSIGFKALLATSAADAGLTIMSMHMGANEFNDLAAYCMQLLGTEAGTLAYKATLVAAFAYLAKRTKNSIWLYAPALWSSVGAYYGIKFISERL